MNRKINHKRYSSKVLNIIIFLLCLFILFLNTSVLSESEQLLIEENSGSVPINVLNGKNFSEGFQSIDDKQPGIYKDEQNCFCNFFQYFLLFLILTGAIIFGAFFWNWSLKKKVENRTKALKESEKHYKNLFNNALVGIFRSRLSDGLYLDVNSKIAEIIGLPMGKIVGKMRGLDLFQNPGQRQELISKLLKDGEAHGFEVDLTLHGRDVTLSISVRAYHEYGYMEGAAIDITEKKRSEEELRNLRNYLSNIIDSMPSVLVGVDNDGRITQWNRTAEKTTGLAVSTVQGQKISDVFPRMRLEIEKINQSIRTRESIQYQKRPRLSEKGTFYEDVTIYPLICNGVEGAVIRVDDVTDKVQMEEIMIQSEKMLFLGGLAAGMAHEINNPIAGMIQTASVMNNRLTDMEMAANRHAAVEAGISMDSVKNFMEKRGILRMVHAIDESGRRVAEIVDNMLSFARKSESSFSSNDITYLLDRSLELAATDYDLKKKYDFKAIEIKREYEANLPLVSCEAGKIQQVILNILRNGAQAMHDAETLKPEFILRTQFEKEQNTVCIEIEDNGPGMDEMTQRRLFEPFYTTKSVGEGTGLGLSLSYFIITENHKGEMMVESRQGDGAKFIIRLPLERSPA